MNFVRLCDKVVFVDVFQQFVSDFLRDGFKARVKTVESGSVGPYQLGVGFERIELTIVSTFESVFYPFQGHRKRNNFAIVCVYAQTLAKVNVVARSVRDVREEPIVGDEFFNFLRERASDFGR